MQEITNPTFWEALLNIFETYPVVMLAVLCGVFVLISAYNRIQLQVNKYAITQWRRLPESTRNMLGFFAPNAEQLAVSVWDTIYRDVKVEVEKTVDTTDDELLVRIDNVIRSALDSIDGKENSFSTDFNVEVVDLEEDF